MKRATLKIAQTRIADRDDQAAMSEALSRLYRTATHNIGDVTAALTPSERAKLAVFCYGRAHLNAVGLAIAANCDLDHLIAASHSATAGHMLFTQSREPTAVSKAPGGRRSPITLATAAASALAPFALNEPAELIA